MNAQTYSSALLERLPGLLAIDTHVHVESSVRSDPASRSTSFDMPLPTVPELAELYRSLNMAAVVFPVDAPHSLSESPADNIEVAELAAEHSDVLIPFGSIDPMRRENAPTRARQLIEDHGMRGFKFHPALQGFYPNDPKVYPLYEELEAQGSIAVFHTGQIGGGSHARLKYSDPIYLDDVAADFPGLKIVMAHPSFPWQDVALSIAARRPNVYIDLSGWSPRYFPPQLIQHSNTILKKKVMFGSDYPVIHPERWLTDFSQVDFREEVRQPILRGNAETLLGLS